QYALVRDVVAAQRRHRMHEQQFLQPPLLVLSNLGQPHMHVKLTATVLQNMFPSINVHQVPAVSPRCPHDVPTMSSRCPRTQVNLNSVKRCLLVNYDADSQLLDLRHYSIKVVPVGVSRGLKKLLQEKFPNMGRLEDISELL
ncbi:SSF1 protein, partial [Crypturellus soui]|nr:SSF1 protein [Crypturellus soui]